MGDYQEKSWVDGDRFEAADATAMSAELEEQEVQDLTQDQLIAQLAARVTALEGRPYVGNDILTSGDIPTMQRSDASTVASPLSGDLWLTYFTATHTAAKTKIGLMCAAQAAAATPTLIRLGVWRVESNLALTLIGSTPNEPGLFTSTFTEYVRDLSAPVNFVQGQRYAWGPLVISGAAMPNFMAGPPIRYQMANLLPRLNARITGQTDLPASIVSQPGATQGSIWARFTT